MSRVAYISMSCICTIDNLTYIKVVDAETLKEKLEQEQFAARIEHWLFWPW